MNRAKALELTEKMLGFLQPHVERIEVAGSVRRLADSVKDVELVAIFDDHLLTVLDDLVHQGVIIKANYNGSNRWGDKYRGFCFAVYPDFKFELFRATSTNWGYILWLRTGPGDANIEAVTRLNKTQYRAIDGYIFRGSNWQNLKKGWRADDMELVDIPDEQAMFEILGMPLVIEPSARSVQAYRHIAMTSKRQTPHAPKAKPQTYDYSFLGAHHAQRNEYESHAPNMWKHRQLPQWIRETQLEISLLAGERVILRDKVREMRARQADPEIIAKYITEGMNAKHRQEMLQPLLRAYALRFLQGVEAHGFDTFGVDMEAIRAVATHHAT